MIKTPKSNADASYTTTRIEIPESEFQVRRFIAPECGNNGMVNFKVKGKTVQCHNDVITVKKGKRPSTCAILTTLAGVILAIFIAVSFFYNVNDAKKMPETATTSKPVTDEVFTTEPSTTLFTTEGGTITNDATTIEPNYNETTEEVTTMEPITTEATTEELTTAEPATTETTTEEVTTMEPTTTKTTPEEVTALEPTTIQSEVHEVSLPDDEDEDDYEDDYEDEEVTTMKPTTVQSEVHEVALPYDENEDEDIEMVPM